MSNRGIKFKLFYSVEYIAILNNYIQRKIIKMQSHVGVSALLIRDALLKFGIQSDQAEMAFKVTEVNPLYL